MKSITITTDGACHPNPGRGGWAAILRYGTSVKEICGAEPKTTNNRMEFQAILAALASVKEPCKILLRSDSKTALAWCRPDAFKKEKHRAKHPNVWPMVQQYRELAQPHEISFEWVRGHAGDPDNERCDELAEDQSRRPF